MRKIVSGGDERKSNLKQKRQVATFNRKKLLIAFGVIVCLLTALSIRLIYITRAYGDTYSRTVLDQQDSNSTVIPFKRGDILDRNGAVLATSEKVYNLILDAYVLLSSRVSEDYDCVEPTIKALSKYFDIPEEDIRERVNAEIAKEETSAGSASRYIILKKRLPYDKYNPFYEFTHGDSDEAKYIRGVWFEEDYLRKYPYNTMASDLIGFTNAGNVGAYGIEEYYNEELNGTNGRGYSYFDQGTVENRTISPINGYTAVSTIDLNIQRIVEKHMGGWYEKVGALNAAVIVMDPNNGEILAMASYPNYDLNDPRDLSKIYTEEELDKMSDAQQVDAMASLWKNFCISDLFEPGSTMKVVTLAAALDEADIDEESVFHCDGGLQIGEYYVACSYKYGHGAQDINQAVGNSCNDAFMEIAFKVGAANFSKYQKAFGLGARTGIDLPGEEAGLLYDPDSMIPVDLATNGFGQNYNVTMVQVAAAFSAAVNGGNYYTPHVVKEIRSESGNVVRSVNKELVRTVISEKTSNRIKESLLYTVESGLGKTAGVKGYSIGGKTGTAEKLPRSANKKLLSFIGCAPAMDPEVVVYVVVDEAKLKDYGDSSVACGITSDIFRELLPYMQIYPEAETEVYVEQTDTEAAQE